MAGSYAPIISDSLCCPYDANSNKCNHTKQLTAVPDKKKDRTNGITTSQTMNQFSNARRSLTLIENANCCVKLKQYRAIQASDCILWACEREFYIRKGEINFCFVFSVLTVMQLAFFCVCRLLCTDCYVQIVMYRLLCTDCYVQIVMYRLLCTDCYVQIIMYRLLCTDCYVQIWSFDGERGSGGEGVRGSWSWNTNTNTGPAANTTFFFFFACFFPTIACLEVGTSATVFRGTKLVPLHCELVGGRRAGDVRLAVVCSADARSWQLRPCFSHICLFTHCYETFNT